MTSRSVHFSDPVDTLVSIEETEYESEQPFSGFERDSCKRSCLETSIFHEPSSQLAQVRALIDSWRDRDLSVVLGNLGRQPFLLNYYLDLCFGSEEVVKIECDWKIFPDYQTTVSRDIDFLIYVEPHFGFTLHRNANAKHTVILSSHLSLHYWGDEHHVHYYYLNLISVSNLQLPDPHLQNYKVFKPPIFHDQTYNHLPSDSLLLDISDSKCAREGYLRLLTGWEMIQHRAHDIQMPERYRKVLKSNVEVTLQRVQRLSEQKLWKHFIDPLNGDKWVMGQFLCSYLNIPETNFPN